MEMDKVACLVESSLARDDSNTDVRLPRCGQIHPMQDHILDFKKRMEFYRDNPNVKSGGELYTADSAVIELERLLNFNFCYTNIECDQKTYETSEVIMPLDDLLKINDPNLMQVYYNKTIDTIQAQMGRVNYGNMKLLLVDIEVTGYEVKRSEAFVVLEVHVCPMLDKQLHEWKGVNASSARDDFHKRATAAKVWVHICTSRQEQSNNVCALFRVVLD